MTTIPKIGDRIADYTVTEVVLVSTTRVHVWGVTDHGVGVWGSHRVDA